MVTRIVLFNSQLYDKADIDLRDSDAIQLVGPNNIGKSTLIYALNYLYVIDGKRMVFSGKRPNDKTTVHHYFPEPDNSFLIFEIFKKRYYCLVIKRNAEGELEYYKLDNEYDENLFIKKSDEPKAANEIFYFKEVQANCLTAGIGLEKFKSKQEVFNFVYQKGKNNNAVVWLDANVKSDGLSNNFSKIYKYFIYAKDIDNHALKDALIVADKKDKEHLPFSKGDQDRIDRIHAYNDEIKTIKSLEKEFYNFKNIVDKYTATRKNIEKIVSYYNKTYATEVTDLKLQLSQQKKHAEEYEETLQNELKLRKDKLLQDKGKQKSDCERASSELQALKQNEKTILDMGTDSLGLDKLALEKLQKEKWEIESRLAQIEHHDLQESEILHKIETAKKHIANTNKKINDYENLLVHKISSKQEIRELLNAIFSEDFFSTLPKKNLKKEVNEIYNSLQIFDGAIFLPPIEPKPIESIEQLKHMVLSWQKDLKANQELLPIVQDFQRYKKEQEGKEKEIQEHKTRIELIESLPSIKKSIGLAKVSFTEKEKQLTEISNTIIEMDKQITKLEKLQKENNMSINDTKRKLEKISEQKRKVEESQIFETTETTEIKDTKENVLSSEELFADFENHFKQMNDLKNKKDRQFDSLKRERQSVEADEENFIQEFETDLATVTNKEKSIDDLLEAISSIYSANAKGLLSSYEQFKTFVVNSFNAKLGKVKISDIDSLKIELRINETLKSDLQKIIGIQNLDSNQIAFDKEENLNILKKYLEQQKTIEFSDLFTMRLHLERKGKKKHVDLKDQVESDGTDKMIRLVIIMTIINKLITNDRENKILIFIDELGTIDDENRLAILQFCKENNFFPISAALQPYSGFDKFYTIFRNEGKITVSKETGNELRYERN